MLISLFWPPGALNFFLSAFLEGVWNYGDCCWQRMPTWFVLDKYSGFQVSCELSWTEETAHMLMYFTAGKSIVSAWPLSVEGGDKGSLRVSFPVLCLMRLFPLLILLYTLSTTDSEACESFQWVPKHVGRPGTPNANHKTPADKTNQKQQTKHLRRETASVKQSLTSLDYLETWSATLGFCMIFFQM